MKKLNASVHPLGEVLKRYPVLQRLSIRTAALPLLLRTTAISGEWRLALQTDRRRKSWIQLRNLGLSKKGTVKRYDKILERIGRLKQKNSRVASHYTIDVTADDKKDKALRITVSMQTQAGEQIYVRMSTRAEIYQQQLYDALGFSSDLVGRKKTVINQVELENVVPTFAD